MNLKFSDEFLGFRSFLSEIPNINCGGCGIAALAMIRFLEKENIYPNVVICCETNKLGLEILKNNINTVLNSPLQILIIIQLHITLY